MTLVDGRLIGQDSDSVAMVPSYVLPLNDATVHALCERVRLCDVVLRNTRPSKKAFFENCLIERVLIQETLNELAPEGDAK